MKTEETFRYPIGTHLYNRKLKLAGTVNGYSDHRTDNKTSDFYRMYSVDTDDHDYWLFSEVEVIDEKEAFYLKLKCGVRSGYRSN